MMAEIHGIFVPSLMKKLGFTYTTDILFALNKYNLKVTPIFLVSINRLVTAEN